MACLANSEMEHNSKDFRDPSTSKLEFKDDTQTNQRTRPDLRLPFGDWFNLQGSKQKHRKEASSEECTKQNMFLPKITMVGISTGETGQMSKASLKKTMEDLTKELEHIDQENANGCNSSWNNEFEAEDRDPLFVANVGDYYSGVAKSGSARWVRGGTN